MNYIKKIFKRFTDTMVKARTLPLLLSVQNIVFALLVLIFANVIISKGKVNGELDYVQIKLFYNIVIYILFLFVFIYAPYFLAGSLNTLVKNNTIEYLLSTKMSVKEITYAVFLRGFANVIILLVSAFPIACVSFYFGGIGIIKIVKIIMSLLSCALLFSAISLFISSCYKEINVTVLTSYIVSFVLFAIHVVFLKYIINIGLITVIYTIFCILVSILFILRAYRGRVFTNK